MRKFSYAVFFTAMLYAPVSLAQTPPPPFTLALKPSLNWTKFAFADDAKSKSDYAALEAWAKAAMKSEAERRTTELRAIIPGAKPLEPGCFDMPMCLAYQTTLDMRAKFKNQAEIDKAAGESEDILNPAIMAYLNFDAAEAMNLKDGLLYFAARDQVTRALFVIMSKQNLLSEGARALASSSITVMGVAGDMEALATVKELWDKEGWPLKSKAGEKVASAAWLIVQHGDTLTQARALTQLSAHLSDGEVSRSEYALLYDRVHLQTDGKQRFGTQFSCVGGKWDVAPLEDANRVDALRTEFGLNPLADYRRDMEKMYAGVNCQ